MEPNEYDFIKTLTTGSFGSIYLVRRKQDDKVLAIKKQNKYEYGYAKNEAEIMSKLQHPNVLSFYKSWEKGNKSYILMEYATEGTLYELLNSAYYNNHKPMDENDAIDFFSQLLLGLEHMHSRSIMHRDLKPENIMFAGPHKRVKIIDFGLSRDVMTEFDVPTVNPNYYSAPENWDEDEPHTFESDVWSIGTLLYEVSTGTEPKHLENDLEVLEELPPLIRNVCVGILKVEPNDRPPCHAVIRYDELRPAMCKYYESLDLFEREIVEEQLHGVIGYDKNPINK